MARGLLGTRVTERRRCGRASPERREGHGRRRLKAENEVSLGAATRESLHRAPPSRSARLCHLQRSVGGVATSSHRGREARRGILHGVPTVPVGRPWGHRIERHVASTEMARAEPLRGPGRSWPEALPSRPWEPSSEAERGLGALRSVSSAAPTPRPRVRIREAFHRTLDLEKTVFTYR